MLNSSIRHAEIKIKFLKINSPSIVRAGKYGAKRIFGAIQTTLIVPNKWRIVRKIVIFLIFGISKPIAISISNNPSNPRNGWVAKKEKVC